MSLLIHSLKYVGGKAGIVDWILENLPDGNTYVEVFGGAAWVLLNKPRHKVEVYNDLNKTLVTFFRVLQDEEKYKKLVRRLKFTLYSREEFRRAIEILDTPDQYSDVDVAWARYVLQEQGFGGRTTAKISDWGRRINHSMVNAYSKLKYLPLIRERLARVQIECRDALEVIRYWDTPQTVFYLDPPYVPATRKKDVLYGDYEQDEQFHERLINLLSEISGAFALSSYQNPTYDRLVERGIAKRLTRKRYASVIGRTRALQSKSVIGTDEWEEMQTRTECLYIKGNGVAKQPSLFGEFDDDDDSVSTTPD